MYNVPHLRLLEGVFKRGRATVLMGWGKEARRWKMTGPQRRRRWRASQRSWPVLLDLLSSVAEPGSERWSCCSYIDHVTMALPLLTRSLWSPASGCCGWTRRGRPPPSHLAGLWAQRSAGSVHLWELWRYLRTQKEALNTPIPTKEPPLWSNWTIW